MTLISNWIRSNTIKIKLFDQRLVMDTSAIFIIAAIIGVCYLTYSWFLKPYKEYCFYKAILKANYKAHIYPFTFFPTNLFKTEKEGLRTHGDTEHACKTLFAENQVVVDMLRGAVYLELVDPQLIRQFYDKVVEGCYIKSEKSIFYTPFKAVIGTGLLLSENEEWKMKRKIMSTVFNFDFIRSKVSFFSSIAKEVLDKIEARQENKGKNEVVMDVNIMLQEIFGTVVIKCFFGNMQLSDIGGKPVFHSFNDLMELNVTRTKNIFGLILGPKFFKYNLRPIDRQVSKLCQQFNQYATNLIKQQIEITSQAKSKQNQRSGVIQLIIREGMLKDSQDSSDKKEGAQQTKYTIKDLINEFETFFFAGTDTSSNSATILIYELSRYKDVQQKIRKEIDDVLQNNVQNISYEKLKEMKYLQKVQKEILRMYTPVPRMFKREVVKEHFLGKIPIKKDVVVSVGIISTHFNKTFYKDPEVFNPDRWDDIDPSKFDPFAYFPFSSGLRNCIGQHLALIEMKIAVIHLLIRYKDFKLQKPEYQKYFRTLYGAENMKTTFIK